MTHLESIAAGGLMTAAAVYLVATLLTTVYWRGRFPLVFPVIMAALSLFSFLILVSITMERSHLQTGIFTAGILLFISIPFTTTYIMTRMYPREPPPPRPRTHGPRSWYDWPRKRHNSPERQDNDP